MNDFKSPHQSTTSKALNRLRSPQKSCGFTDGDEVIVLKNRIPAQVGRVRCVFQDAKNRWILGVEFANPLGDSDGTYKGQQMFSCKPKFGIFCEATEALPKHYYESSTKLPPNSPKSCHTVPKLLNLECPKSRGPSLSPKSPSRVKHKSSNSAFDEAFKQNASLASMSNCDISPNLSTSLQALPASPENVKRSYSPTHSIGKETDYSLGSPDSKSGSKSRSPTPILGKEIDESLEVGSMVQVTKSGYIYYGVIKWIGKLPSKKFLCAGLELEDELVSPPGNDGMFEGVRYFTCPPKHALFCYLHDCRKDNRFQELPVQSTSPYFGPNSSLEVLGDVQAPKCILTSHLGRMKGIQGNKNSCYLDATLFAMFSFHEAFDFLFKLNIKDDTQTEIQRLLQNRIVNPLRSDGFVSANHTYKLRRLLSKKSMLCGLETDEKEPEEILDVILNEIFEIDPLLSFKNGNTNEVTEVNLCQILLERGRDDCIIPDTQSLLTKYFVTHNLYFQNRPKTLLLQVPRSGKDFKVYDSILPSTHLQIGGLCGGVWGNCFMCGKKPYFKCSNCYLSREFHTKYSAVPYCEKCCNVVHAHPDRVKHKPVPATTPRHGISMNLVAVLCIHTSHYVAYCRVPSPQLQPDLIQLDGDVEHKKTYTWVFFDSMSDREGGLGGYNIPLVEECPLMEEWLENPGKLLHHEQDTPSYVNRLLKDALLCIYTLQNN